MTMMGESIHQIWVKENCLDSHCVFAGFKPRISTGVIQLIPPVLSSETLLHILLSSEYSGFRPSTTAVVTMSAPVSVSPGPKFRRYSAQLSRKIAKKVFIVISNVFPTFLTYR